MNIEQLTEQTEEIEEQIAELESEQRRLGDALGGAIAAFDEGRIAELQQRRVALPGEIIRAKIAHQRSLLDLATAKQDADKARVAELQAAAAPIHAQIVALQKQIGPMVAEINLIGQRDNQHRDRKANAKRRLEMLLAERADMLKTETAPVIRSLWQGAAN